MEDRVPVAAQVQPILKDVPGSRASGQVAPLVNETQLCLKAAVMDRLNVRASTFTEPAMRKLGSYLLAIAVVAGGLTGCGNSGGDADQQNPSVAPSDATRTGQSPATTASTAKGESTSTSGPPVAPEPLDLENVDVQGIAVTPEGTVFVPDATDSRILRINRAGKITHFAGEPGLHGFEGDGGQASKARLFAPLGLALDTSGDLYVTDHANGRIRKIDQEGTITTVAGSEQGGFAGDGGPATTASLQEPVAVAVDRSGQMYIADRDNNRVRAVGADGTITTLAGNGSTGPERTEGPAIEAALGLPVGVAAGAGGVVYISDEPAHRIYRVGADGVMTTFAGTGKAGYSGDGGPATHAQLNGPYGLAVDARGNLYIADLENHVIRVVDRKGIMKTVAGRGTAGFGGDGKPATKALLKEPYAVALDQSGRLYIADSGNRRVRRVNSDGKISTILP